MLSFLNSANCFLGALSPGKGKVKKQSSYLKVSKSQRPHCMLHKISRSGVKKTNLPSGPSK